MGISAPGMASRRLIMAMAMAAAAVLAEEKMLYGEFGEMTPSQWEAKNTQLLKDQQKNSRSVMNKAGELETIWQYWDSDKRALSKRLKKVSLKCATTKSRWMSEPAKSSLVLRSFAIVPSPSQAAVLLSLPCPLPLPPSAL